MTAAQVWQTKLESDLAQTPRLETFGKYLLLEKVATGGMAAKLEAACAAIERGVRQVRVGDVSAIADRANGTRISLEPVHA